MSYSAITDPCLSEEVLQQIDKTTAFYKKQPNAVPFLEKYGEGLLYIDKLGKSLVSKFPQDQDDELWKYIRDAVRAFFKSCTKKSFRLFVPESLKIFIRDAQMKNRRNSFWFPAYEMRLAKRLISLNSISCQN